MEKKQRVLSTHQPQLTANQLCGGWWEEPGGGLRRRSSRASEEGAEREWEEAERGRGFKSRAAAGVGEARAGPRGKTWSDGRALGGAPMGRKTSVPVMLRHTPMGTNKFNL